MRTLYIDCSMGCAGDMLTAALLELHPDKDDFLSRMNAALGGKAVLSASPDSKCGLRGTHVTVLINGDEEGEKTHHHHEHTSITEIMAFIDSVPLDEAIRENAKKVYSIIAEAESRVHGHPMENVHFHEVGSLDALADVLSVCALMHELAPERILASEVNVGSGTVRCAHGVLPVPALFSFSDKSNIYFLQSGRARIPFYSRLESIFHAGLPLQTYPARYLL